MPNQSSKEGLTDRRIFAYLQNAYARKTQWLSPLPWKPNFKFLFDQAYMKDIKFKQEVQYDVLEKEGEPLCAGNNLFVFLQFNCCDYVHTIYMYYNFKE